MTTQHKDDYCVNEDRIAVLETRVKHKHERIDDLEEDIRGVDEKIEALEQKHHKDFVSFRNSINDLQKELVSIHSTIKTIGYVGTALISIAGVIVAIIGLT